MAKLHFPRILPRLEALDLRKMQFSHALSAEHQTRKIRQVTRLRGLTPQPCAIRMRNGMNEISHDADPRTGQPVGFPVDATPARPPGPVTLTGRYGAVERLDPERHGGPLWEAVAGHPPLWTYMSFGPFAEAPAFSQWLASRLPSADPYFYAIVQPDGRAVGLAALMSIRPEMRVIEIGNILLGPRLQRTALATEAQYLLARHAFETLGYRRYEWKCDSLNAPSRRAALRFGLRHEGIF